MITTSYTNYTTAGDTSCERLKNPKNGFVVVIHPRRVGSHAKYNCDQGFYLSGPRFRTCQLMGWTDTTPKCLRKIYIASCCVPQVFGIKLDQFLTKFWKIASRNLVRN